MIFDFETFLLQEGIDGHEMHSYTRLRRRYYFFPVGRHL